MSGISNYGAFLLAGILFNRTPGNDAIYILSRSIARGKQAGIYSSLGIGTGSIFTRCSRHSDFRVEDIR